jgi:hypothetical protein
VAVSEGIYQGEARNALLEYYDQSLADSWTMSSDVEYVDLDRGDAQSLDVSLSSGQIAGVTASCDEDCVDLNIEVKDADGFTVVRDQVVEGTARYPFVEFSTVDSATYNVEIGMADCTAEPCWVAYLVLRDRSTAGRSFEDLSRVYRTELSSEWPLSSIIQSANLGTGRYVFRRDFVVGQPVRILALCAEQCLDLNIEVKDPDGFTATREEPLNAGAGTGAYAEFIPASVGTYEVEIGTRECTEQPCAFSYMVVRKPGPGT